MPNNITVKSVGVWKKFCNAQLAKEQEKKMCWRYCQIYKHCLKIQDIYI